MELEIRLYKRCKQTGSSDTWEWEATMNKIIMTMLLLTLLLTITACGKKENTEGSNTRTEIVVENGESFVRFITEIGTYTAEELGDGFWLAYEDSTFDLYPQGGDSLDNGATYNGPRYYNQFYISNEKVERLPTITDKEKVVVVWNGDCNVYLYPVQGVEYATRVSAADLGDEFADILGEGYGIVTPKNENSYQLEVHYDDQDGSKSYDVAYINGKSAIEYELAHTVHEYKYSHYSEERIGKVEYYSLQKGDVVTLGIPYGTTLVEYECQQDYTCFYSYPDHNNEGDSWYYAPQLTPTPQGYASLDFSGIPDGKYIMIVRGNKQYIGTILNLQNN